MTDDKLELRLTEDRREAYIPGIDGYISISADGEVVVKKPSGQEVFKCEFWPQPELWAEG